MKKILLSVFLVVLLVFSGCSSTGDLNADSAETKYIFVHGLSGWGSYDAVDRFLPYWGMRTGSLMKYLRGQGFDTYAASVSPEGSAWDRACELYAQLTGSIVDYGLVHSRKAGHARYGEDFSGKPLIKDYDKSELVLLGHSFGGITIRLFSDLLVNGSPEEREATPESELSPLFAGGDNRVIALVTLATPNSGTTAYNLQEDPDFETAFAQIPKKYAKASEAMNSGSEDAGDGRASWDYAAYDMYIDNALAFSAEVQPQQDIYYFAVPCVSTSVVDGKVTADPKTTPSMFMASSILMSAYTGTTRGGFQIGPEWQRNDGLVNTISAGAPIGHPSESYEGQELVPGRWYVMPEVRGEHMCLQGGLFIKHKIRPFYMELLNLLKTL